MYRRTNWGFSWLALFIALFVWLLYTVPIQRGIDLQGGTRLIYKLDLSRVAEDPRKVAEDVKGIVETRLNAFGLKDLSLSIQGENRLEVQVPGVGEEAVKDIKDQIERAGMLTWHLVMTGPEHNSRSRMDEYVKQEEKYLEDQKVYAAEKRAWDAARARAEKAGVPFTQPRPESPKPPDYIVRWEGEYKQNEQGKWEFQPRVKGRKVLGNTESLKVEGKFLASVYPTQDQQMNPALGFSFQGEGASRFGDLTGSHLKELLAIVLDDDIRQVATIQERISTNGILHGRFTNDEVRGLVAVLRGSLPTKPTLESETTVGALFGQKSVEQGAYAVVIGLAVVMFAIALYYLFAGLVANFALVFNIVAVLAYVACFRQTLTLPGIAGILLTIGMAVDANILIFERVREERKRGKGLTQALTTGYQRAFSVIFDSNLTTVITGLVLFNFGTIQVRGFAVTLIAGIIVSFVSALFITRLIISWAYNFGLLKQFKMLQAFETPRVPFVAYQRPFLVATFLVIVASWVLVVNRGKENYGIDFNGGARITMNFKESLSQAELRAHVDYLGLREPALEDILRGAVLQSLNADVEGKASSWTVLTQLKTEKEGMKTARAQEAKPPEDEVPKDSQTGGQEDESKVLRDLREQLEWQLSAPKDELEKQAVTGVDVGSLKTQILALPGVQRLKEETGLQGMIFRVNFVEFGVTKDWIKEQLDARLVRRFPAKPEGGFEGVKVEEVTLLEKGASDDPVVSYRVRLSRYEESSAGVAEEQRAPRKSQVSDAVQTFFKDPPPTEEQQPPFKVTEPFPEVSTVSGRVARDLQGNAIVAIFISILGIIFYISLRFEFIFGLAAIAALVHDVLITIGVLAVTDHFLGNTLPMKINLPEVAALLTIIGYSINDTIVVFDRIRENLRNYSKKKLTFTDCVDMSINQTLSRTLWTSVTTLVTVLSLLIFGGEAVRGFAYTFAIGLVTGTYSSVFVASPVLILLHRRAVARREALATARA